jgi:hypothetical protein
LKRGCPGSEKNNNKKYTSNIRFLLIYISMSGKNKPIKLRCSRNENHNARVGRHFAGMLVDMYLWNDHGILEVDSFAVPV